MKVDFKSPHNIIDKFVSLLAISHKINSEKDFDELLNLITSEAAKLVDAERATIFILDKSTGQLWAKTALGVSDTIRFDARLGIAGAVLISGKNMIVEDAYKSPLFYPSIDSLTGFHTRNILSVPLRNIRREISGVFQVLNKKDGKFSSEDEQLVEALALQASIALENAKAMTDLEHRQQELIEENETLRKEVEDRYTTKSILGSSARMDQIRSLIERTADSSVSVLVTGENGTGKELSARAIHYMSPRRTKPFVAVNCAALPEQLVESELFGIEKGVATGVERRVGRIESANGGTLFLDEIGDLSLTAQAKLLRVLQEREVDWVGGRKPVPVDIRLVAATNKDLKGEIQQGKFRQDLFFRLNVVHLHMPPLRDIRADIPVLAMHFLRKQTKEMGREIAGFESEALKALTTYSWPGNVRELENEVKRASVLTVGKMISLEDLSDSVREERLVETVPEAQGDAAAVSTGKSKALLKDRVSILEMQMIRDAMTQTGNDKRRTAKMLGLSHQGLLNKLKRYGLGT
jgi:transcriptional regulator with GAF, ATPase, and Fis domain